MFDRSRSRFASCTEQKSRVLRGGILNDNSHENSPEKVNNLDFVKKHNIANSF